MKNPKQSKGERETERDRDRETQRESGYWCVWEVLYMYFCCITEDDFDREGNMKGKN